MLRIGLEQQERNNDERSFDRFWLEVKAVTNAERLHVAGATKHEIR